MATITASINFYADFKTYFYKQAIWAETLNAEFLIPSINWCVRFLIVDTFDKYQNNAARDLYVEEV